MRGLVQTVRDALDGLEASALELRELTVILPLRQESAVGRQRLQDKLNRLDRATPSPFAKVPGLHQARFILLEHAKLQANEAAPAFPFGPLIFNCVYEGDVEDLLYELFEQCAEALDGVLTHCREYPGSRHTESCVTQLLAARIPSGFLFRDRDASRTEIVRSLELRRRFVEFLASQAGANDNELQHAFERFRNGRWLSESRRPQPTAASTSGAFDLRLDYGFPLLRPFEYPIAAERYWVRRAAELARARLRRATREARRLDQGAPALRGVHAKHHGLLRAWFTVRADLPIELQHGVFEPGSRHRAWVRVSNASDRIQSDDVPDARGLAIKLEDAGDYGEPLDVGMPQLGDEDTVSQDFVLVSHPTFFVKDVRDYAVFRSILDLRDRTEQAMRLALFGLRRPREALIFAQSLFRRIDHPLDIEYHSMTASALGMHRAVKYCVRPAAPPAAARRSFGRRRSPNHLRESLIRTLDPITGRTFSLEFCLIVPEREPLPVEDPRIDWRSEGARCIPVATLEIEPQDFGAEERATLAENMVFSPWHTLQEHRPLGSLNRARLEVYRASAELRRAHNGVTRPQGRATVVNWNSLQARSTRDSEQAGTKRRRSRRLH